jgi:EmrB/QacA subfamily drug resistance transporter
MGSDNARDTGRLRTLPQHNQGTVCPARGDNVSTNSPEAPNSAALPADSLIGSEHPAALGEANRWRVLVVVVLAQLMIAADTTVVNTLAAKLQQSMGLSTTSLAWVVNIYVLLFGGLLLLGGRLSDVVGRRLVFLIGLLAFTGASLAAGLTDSEGALLTARAVQGVAAAAMSPAALSILVTSFPDPRERGKAFGMWGASIGIGASLGLLLGGALVDVDWRYAFWINVPIGMGIAIAGFRLIRTPRPTGDRPPTDVAGAVTGTGGLLALVYSIINSSTDGWTDGRTLGGFVLAAVLIAAFVVIESRSTVPLLPLRLLRIRSVIAGSVGEFLTTALMFPTFFLVSLYLQNVLGYSPLKVGLAWLPGTVLFLVLAPLVQGAIEKVGTQVVYLAGTVVFAGALILVLTISEHSGYAGFMLPFSLLFGLGMVLCLIVNPVVGTAQATPQDAGITSAVLNVSTQVGGAIGLSVAVTIYNSRSAHLTARGHSAASSMVDGLQTAYIALFVLLALSMINGLVTYRGLGGRRTEVA